MTLKTIVGLKCIIALSIISGMGACNWMGGYEVPDGGPCSYKDTKLVARVIAIETYDSIHFDVLFKLDSNALITPPDDTISYSQETRNYFEKAELDSLGIQPGMECTYLVRDIIDGHCNPHITRLILQKPKQ